MKKSKPLLKSRHFALCAASPPASVETRDKFTDSRLRSKMHCPCGGSSGPGQSTRRSGGVKYLLAFERCQGCERIGCERLYIVRGPRKRQTKTLVSQDTDARDQYRAIVERIAAGLAVAPPAPEARP